MVFGAMRPTFRLMSAGTPRCADGNGTLTHLFFSADDVEVAQAKAICRRCPLADACRSAAIARVEPYGVWGGALLVDGQPVALPPRRGRPSRRARIDFLDDEVRRPAHLVA